MFFRLVTMLSLGVYRTALLFWHFQCSFYCTLVPYPLFVGPYCPHLLSSCLPFFLTLSCFHLDLSQSIIYSLIYAPTLPVRCSFTLSLSCIVGVFIFAMYCCWMLLGRVGFAIGSQAPSSFLLLCDFISFTSFHSSFTSWFSMCLTYFPLIPPNTAYYKVY